MRKRWKMWAPLLTLVLLTIGVRVAVLWAGKCHAERRASTLRLGMTLDEASSLCDKDVYVWAPLSSLSSPRRSFLCWYADGSRLTVRARRSPERFDVFLVTSLEASPPDFPTTHLRRLLARILPFLED
jgi:hypothetical protein